MSRVEMRLRCTAATLGHPRSEVNRRAAAINAVQTASHEAGRLSHQGTVRQPPVDGAAAPTRRGSGATGQAALSLLEEEDDAAAGAESFFLSLADGFEPSDAEPPDPEAPDSDDDESEDAADFASDLLSVR